MTVDELIRKMLPYSKSNSKSEYYIIFVLRFEDGEYIVPSLPEEERIGKCTHYIAVPMGCTVSEFIGKLSSKYEGKQ